MSLADPQPLSFFATCDLAAVVRGRAVPEELATGAMTTGLGWVPADLALTCFGSIGDNVFGSTGDLRLLPDPEARFTLGGHGDVPAMTVFAADQVALDGSPWSACPRSLLRRTLEEFRERTGLRVVAAFEHEFVIKGLQDSHPFALGRLRSAEPFGSRLIAALRENGLQPENWLPEYGPGQFEVTIAPAAALHAADRAIMVREIVRDLARRCDLGVSFSPILDPDSVGNGVHIHITLIDESGSSVMFDSSGPAQLSETARRFAAGIIGHSAALPALTAASRISYLRLTPHRWSAGGAFLADRNREALVRICPTHRLGGRSPAEQLHLEFRAADATANPWIALAAVIRAGMQGLVDEWDPAHVWPENVSESELADVSPLPSSLPEALAGLVADATLSTWLGEPLLSTYLGVKRAELAALEGCSDEEACRRLADVY